MTTETLRPAGEGTQTNIPQQFPNRRNHYDKVDEDTPDEDTTRVMSFNSVGLFKDTYLMDDSAITDSDVVNNVTVVIRLRGSIDSQSNIGGMGRTVIRTHNTDYRGPLIQMTSTSYNNFSTSYPVNPNTLQPWTGTELDDLEAGLEVRSQRNPETGEWVWCHCTQVFVEVLYNVPRLKIILGDGLASVIA